jgi:hypothetical protein
MPESSDRQEQVAKPVKRMGRPNVIGPSGGVVSFRTSEDQRQKMEQTAAEADLSISEFMRLATAICCSPDELKKILRAQDESTRD